MVLGVDRPLHATIMQVSGTGLCLAADSLRRAIDKSRSLHGELLKSAYAFQAHLTQTALANGRSTIEQRLCRWLLLADRRRQRAAADPRVPVLDAGRATLRGHLAVQALEAEGLIAARWGRISIRLDTAPGRCRNDWFHRSIYAGPLRTIDPQA